MWAAPGALAKPAEAVQAGPEGSACVRQDVQAAEPSRTQGSMPTHILASGQGATSSVSRVRVASLGGRAA